jgi:acyl-CoA thioester hydrolase
MTPHCTEYRVIYGDSDSFDVVYYANYFDFFERGRTELFRSMGLSYRSLADQGMYLPVAETHCAFKQSARYDDLLVIETTINYLRKARIRFDHAIYRKEPRALLAEGYTVHAFVSSARKATRPPQQLVECIRALDAALIQ